MSFHSMPVVLAEHLTLYCQPQDLSRLSRVNHAFHAIFNPVLYKRNAAATGLPPCYPWTHEHDPKDCWTCPVDKAFRSCLHWAVYHDSLSTIKLGVAYGSDVNKINDVADFIPYEEDPESTPICGPIKRATHEILQLLLERDVIYSVICDEGNIPGLHCAVAEGSLPAIDAFIQHKCSRPTDRDAAGQTPLHWVEHCEDQDLVCAIIERLAQWGVPLDAEVESQWGDWHGGKALNMLIGRRKFEPALKLLQLGADPTVEQDEDWGLQLLSHCIDGRDKEYIPICSPELAERNREAGLELLSLLIQKGIDPGKPRKVDRPHDLDYFEDSRPLLSALLTSDARCIQILFDAGGMARESIYKNNHDNILGDFVEMMVDAVEEGISLREMKDEVESRKESVCLLLNGGARIDSRDDESSALSKACEIEQGFGILDFLAENATCRNAEVEYVVGLRDMYKRDEIVWEKLDRFYQKLLAEKNEREGIQDVEKSGRKNDSYMPNRSWICSTEEL
ncbi:hypothetical protein J7337_012292 [Fusarium musae]|uniref:Ankyrin n=1 Tax=Fusarium musae TaxID=1042133 RepID=A0A9P8D5H6_9HYPO|nr:hypothetical protein J7337_012292 [Fusarium musae]KAG9495734.1 hypothetical protein J7337_012292 [Fusarium musae]